jgi:2-polyprenyl-3-methyl-5-hydroxy-6-metoxy-1,4-benzoquinol methylase
MNKVDVISRAPDDRRAVTPASLRTPLKAAQFVLPVWGYSYVRYFLECSLPTLLAPGNVPAVVAALPSRFVILTSAEDAAYIREHPAFRRLAASCETELRLIDHLITDGNYSATITLAYVEAVREAGEAMLDICFFFLVSDYIVADGSLGNALRRMQKGISAVVVGNFQVAREDALPWLQEQLAGAEQALALPPRVLMQWALNHLHPVTLANTVNIPFSHNWHTNRLFWRVDGNTILGRFYLMHMLCVRPETTNFIIGASCDYSFIPEMCPSGLVEAIADSDEYLVIELQPIKHESAFLRPGPLAPQALARSLNDWATSLHRENVRHSLVFHAGDLPHKLGDTNTKADEFVAEVERHLTPEPLPHRGHPYWRGAMAAFYDATGRKLNEDEWRYALGLPATDNRITQWLVYQAKYVLMGRPPHVLPWHPAWPDYKAVLAELTPFFENPSSHMLMLSNEPTAFSLSLADSGERVHRMRCVPFLQAPRERFVPLHGRFNLCLLELPETDLRYGGELVDRIAPLMKHGVQIIVSVINRRMSSRRDRNERNFDENVTFQSARLIKSGVVPTEVRFVPANIARRMVRRGMLSLRILMNKRPWLSVPLAFFGGGSLVCLSLIGNLDSLRPARRASLRGRTSSFIMRLVVEAPSVAVARTAARPIDIEGDNQPATAEVARAADRHLSFEETREPQYNRCIELKQTFGLASLGLMTNQVWYDDPRRLTFLLARYKFVAKMLSGSSNVGEVGCGDAFGTRVVLQEVPDVTVYDFDPVFIEDIRERQDERWPLKAEVHDIVAGPLPRRHEALFCLDVLEHIAPEKEHIFLGNLCESLAPNGLLMIGTPSLESQPYASPPSKAGHINCKSGSELKALLERYFAHVFMFSMNDEVVHTGFTPMAHYLFALCAEPRWEPSDKPRWEEGDIKSEIRDESPTFEICEVKDGGTFYVQITEADNEPRRVGNFTTAAEAARWIREQTLDWIRVDRSTSY